MHLKLLSCKDNEIVWSNEVTKLLWICDNNKNKKFYEITL